MRRDYLTYGLCGVLAAALWLAGAESELPGVPEDLPWVLPAEGASADGPGPQACAEDSPWVQPAEGASADGSGPQARVGRSLSVAMFFFEMGEDGKVADTDLGYRSMDAARRDLERSGLRMARRFRDDVLLTGPTVRVRLYGPGLCRRRFQSNACIRALSREARVANILYVNGHREGTYAAFTRELLPVFFATSDRKQLLFLDICWSCRFHVPLLAAVAPGQRDMVCATGRVVTGSVESFLHLLGRIRSAPAGAEPEAGADHPGSASRPLLPQPGTVSWPLLPQPGSASRPLLPQPGTVSWPLLPQAGTASWPLLLREMNALGDERLRVRSERDPDLADDLLEAERYLLLPAQAYSEAEQPCSTGR